MTIQTILSQIAQALNDSGQMPAEAAPGIIPQVTKADLASPALSVAPATLKADMETRRSMRMEYKVAVILAANAEPENAAAFLDATAAIPLILAAATLDGCTVTGFETDYYSAELLASGVFRSETTITLATHYATIS
jgi:hypothetical protein